MRPLLCAGLAWLFFSAAGVHAARIELKPLIVTHGDPGDPLYLVPRGAGYDGIALLMIESAEGIAGCTGALLGGGKRLLTAAHCLTDSTGSLNVLSLSASFDLEGTPEVIPGRSVHPHPLFTGSLREGNDVAVVVLEREASAGIPRYDFYTGSAEIGSIYEVVGFGAFGTGDTGAVGTDLLPRRGWNTFDATMAETFGGFPGWTAGDRVLVSDFDNGNPANDALGLFYGIPGLGLGAREVSMAPGDSGAPAFIDGRIAGIASFRLRLNFTDGATSDIDDISNASFGEFNAFTRVSSYSHWLQPVPEPDTAILCLALPALWALKKGAACWLDRRRSRRSGSGRGFRIMPRPAHWPEK
jgi:hypothetical protein